MSLYDKASLVLIPSGTKTGTVYSQKPVPSNDVLGNELVANGTFDVDANWSKDPNWSISNGKATSTGNGRMYQSIPELEGNIGTEVTVSFEITERISGGVVVNCYGVSSGLITEVGTHSFSGTTSDSLNLYINNSGSGNLVGSIDNISVKKIIDGDFTFTRSTQATRVNSQGLIEKERGNLILKSNNLYQSPWTKTDSTVTGGQTGYDGSSDAWLLNSSTTGSPRVEQNVTSTGINTFSIYAKSATDTFIQMRTFGADSEVWFNLATGGIVSSSGAGYITSKAENIGSGWYRCSVTVNGSLSNVRAYPGSAFGVYSTSGNGIYIQDIQLEQGLVATDYIETTTAAVYTGITDNVPRLDYDGDCPSLLLEPQRTNFNAQSEYLNGIGGGGATLTKFDNQTQSPEGLQNAGYVEVANVSQPRLEFMSINFDTTYALSAYVKRINADYIGFGFYQGDFGDNWCRFNIATGTFDAYGGTEFSNANIEDVGDGWYRISAVITTGSSSSRSGLKLSAMSQSSFTTSTIGNQYYVWGIQGEEGSYATSYIPTYGTTVTRNADDLELPTLSTVFDSSGDYTVFFEHGRIHESGEAQFLYLRNVDYNYITLNAQGSGNFNVGLWNGSEFTSAIYSSGDFNVGSPIKVVVRVQDSTTSVFINGSEISINKPYVVPRNFTTYQNNKNHRIHKEVYISEALTDQECIDLTT